MKKEVNELDDELRPEYDFSKMPGGVRGKYIERYRPATNLVLLDPDVAQALLRVIKKEFTRNKT